jgi:hypothetical protein
MIDAQTLGSLEDYAEPQRGALQILFEDTSSSCGLRAV